MTMQLITSTWTSADLKAFEVALAAAWHEPDRWTRVAAQLPGKTVQDILMQFSLLEEDIRQICDADTCASGGHSSSSSEGTKRAKVLACSEAPAAGTLAPRKGLPWTVEEHRLFLLGLAKFGKGSWRSISRQFVLTRTPTQVASHAQKYFLRLNLTKENKKEKRRASIHDMHLA